MWFKKETKTAVEDQPPTTQSQAPVIRRFEPKESDEVLASPVLAEARKLLGYEPHAVTQVAIYEALRKVGVEPLKRSDVDAYKEWMAKEKKGKNWRHVPINEYFAEIPLFALSQAVAIKRELQGAQIFVEYFGDDPDPFMAVLYGNSWIYFATWDEPKFEGRGTK